jgi:hypothetical protein
MDKRVSEALDIARTSVKTLELLSSGVMGDDQERINLLVCGIAGQLAWAAELLRDSIKEGGL